jgi:hypothetical protein
MSYWRAMAGRGGDCDERAMNVSVLFEMRRRRNTSSHACAFESAKEDPIAGARSLSVLWRIGMTGALSAR